MPDRSLFRWTRRGLFALTFLVAGLCGLTQGRGEEPTPDDKPAAPEIEFNRDIRPLLADRCFRCHGPDSAHREANLRFDRESSAKSSHDDLTIIVPGEPDKSEFVRRITCEDEDEKMPPADSGKKLSPKEIDLLKRWIASGAAWQLPWAYIAPQRQPTPKVRDAKWPANWVDYFVLSKLERQRVKPSADTDKVTLIRRVSIDLNGMPPTPDEVDRFVADTSPDAYEKLVDRLLASPRFGERMAIYWLDLTRFANTVGYHGDQEHSISPYRQWVIEALNRNEPFDQFTREQLAGDLLPESTRDQKIATGYNRMLQTSHEGGVQPKEYLAIYAADRVRNLSNVWMGGTMGCAQCHDHKFDPYTAKDFYAMQGFFADIDEAKHFKNGGNRSPTNRDPELEILSDVAMKDLGELRNSVKDLELQLKRCAKKDKAELDEKGKAKPSPEEEALTKRIATEKKRIKAIHANAPRTMITAAVDPRTIRVLPRGNWLDDSGEVVQASIPEFLGKLDVGDRQATRLDLANWLTDREHGVGGLTARVMANRFWYLMFGRGISPSLDDFGGQGQPPSHPEFLDSLADEFVVSGWDVKHMMKLMAMSHAYRQSSIESPKMRERDPMNQLFSHQCRSRYPAEVVRDSVLMASGLLIEEIGGPSSHPYQPPGYYRHLNFPEREYVPDTDDGQWRRGVYMHWQRQFLHPMLKAFDAPSREECTAERPRSNTALSALVLLNDPTFVEAARALAARILQEGGSQDAARIDFAMRWTASRVATADEQELLGKLLAESREYYAKNKEAVDQLLSIGIRPLPAGLDRAEVAAWTIVARTLLSTNEALTRN